VRGDSGLLRLLGAQAERRRDLIDLIDRADLIVNDVNKVNKVPKKDLL